MSLGELHLGKVYFSLEEREGVILGEGMMGSQLEKLKELKECQCVIFLCGPGHGVLGGSSFTFLVRVDSG